MPTSVVMHRNEMLKYIPKKIDQWTFYGKTDEGDWEIGHPQYPLISIFATPFIQGSSIMRIKVDRYDDEVDSWAVPFKPIIKNKQLDAKADAEHYYKVMKQELTKINPAELDNYEG